MAYDYQTQRAKLFTDHGQRMFLQMRDTAHKLIRQAGVVRMDKMMAGVSGDTWNMLACADRLVELGEVHEIPNTMSSAGQHRLFISFDER